MPRQHLPQRLPEGLPVLHRPVRGEMRLPGELQELVSLSPLYFPLLYPQAGNRRPQPLPKQLRALVARASP